MGTDRSPGAADSPTDPYVVVLGIAQDGGRPQTGCRKACCVDRSRRSPACLGIVDPVHDRRWIIDATPDITGQLALLDEVAGTASAVLDGVVLTHAHMGHYTGLVHLGREALAAPRLPVHARPSMLGFLATNSPWRDLIDHGHIDPVEIVERAELSPSVTITAVPVPHRDELSDTVGYIVEGPSARVLWLPDIDSWDGWDRDLIEVIASVDIAYLDGTFFDDGELERDMSLIPHPRIIDTVTRVSTRAPDLAERVRFIHLNHTNPALDPGTAAHAAVIAAGMAVAAEGERHSL
jgi:pyrroloquinoline quinone biosynthesis protein B